MRLLLVEDNPTLGPMLAEGLRDEGHAVDLARDGEDALHFARLESYDAIVLDLMLPRIDGLTVLRRLRADKNATPVLVLTAKDQVGDRVKGLDEGADDYLVKPFAFDELLARLRSLVRRHQGAALTSVLCIGDLEIDTHSKRVVRAGEAIRLSAREYALLECLALRKERVVPRETLLEVVYDADAQPESNVVEVYIGNLRRKIDRRHPTKLIHTRRGLGYILSEVP